MVKGVTIASISYKLQNTEISQNEYLTYTYSLYVYLYTGSLISTFEFNEYTRLFIIKPKEYYHLV